MVGVNLQYFLESVLRFDHPDFMKAMKFDLGPVLGDVGLWCIKCLQDQAKEQGNDELKKKYQVMADIIEKYLESSLDVLGQEKKYHFINKFSPKKCPEQQVKRDSIRHLYSWLHFAP
jgi:hypothetical protein